MNRPIHKALLLLAFSALLTGCETFRQTLRPGNRTAKPQAAESAGPELQGPDAVLDVKSATPKPFFKPSRLTGGLSDEAREIEGDMGIR